MYHKMNINDNQHWWHYSSMFSFYGIIKCTFCTYEHRMPYHKYDFSENILPNILSHFAKYLLSHFTRYISSHFAKYILYFHRRQISVDCWQSHLIPLQKAFLLKLYLQCKWKIVVDAVDTKNINIFTHPKTFI